MTFRFRFVLCHSMIPFMGITDLRIAFTLKLPIISPLVRAFERTHRRFSDLLDCRPIFFREAPEEAGFQVLGAEIRSVRVPVGIVLAAKSSLSRRLPWEIILQSLGRPNRDRSG